MWPEGNRRVQDDIFVSNLQHWVFDETLSKRR